MVTVRAFTGLVDKIALHHHQLTLVHATLCGMASIAHTSLFRDLHECYMFE